VLELDLTPLYANFGNSLNLAHIEKKDKDTQNPWVEFLGVADANFGGQGV
jgi:hypothetical protein